MSYVVITGASSGIGKEFAKRFAKRDFDLLLVATNEDKLLQAKEEINEEYGVNILTLISDLSKSDGAKAVYDYVISNNLNVSCFVNNAGFGDFGLFLDGDVEKFQKMIDLNDKGLMTLAYYFGNYFKEKEFGHIVNIASIAGFMPGPMMATYYATKNYVTSLSRAVSYELKEMGSAVTVTAFCPGPVNTEFNQVAGVSFATASIESKTAARMAITDALNGKRVSIPTFKMKLVRFGARLVPDCLLLKICSNIQQKKIN